MDLSQGVGCGDFRGLAPTATDCDSPTGFMMGSRETPTPWGGSLPSDAATAAGGAEGEAEEEEQEAGGLGDGDVDAAVVGELAEVPLQAAAEGGE